MKTTKPLSCLAAITLALCLCACSAGGKREEIERRKAALVEKQDTALKNAREQLAHYDQILQQVEASYDSLQPIVEAHRNALTATEQELRQLNRLRQHRDSLRVTCQTLGAKIRLIHRRQKETQRP